MSVSETVAVILERRDVHRRAASNEARGSIEQVVMESIAEAFTELALYLLERDYTALREQVRG